MLSKIIDYRLFNEYDYEIDARPGEVLSIDYDAEYNQPTRPSGAASS